MASVFIFSHDFFFLLHIAVLCRLAKEFSTTAFVLFLCLVFFFVIFFNFLIASSSLSIAVLCRLIKEFSIKACKECCFSHGGQYFAAVNGNTISIYNTYTFDNVGNLRLVTKPNLARLPKV